MIFTTIQEFSPAAGEIAYPVLSNRRNIVVIADEALFRGFASHEAAVPDADVVDETPGSEKDDLAVLIDDRTVTGLSPHHSILHVHSTHSL